VEVHNLLLDFASAFRPMEQWYSAGGLPYPDKYGEDTWEDQVLREYWMAYHRVGHATMQLFATLPGESCLGACPDGCDCEYSMEKTLSFARHAYRTLADAHDWYVFMHVPTFLRSIQRQLQSMV
jgi:hypothetical protein